MKRMNTKWKKEVLCFFFCFFLAFLFLLICSKTSPLYTFHDWFDSNAFFTVGRGMAKGMIPYRDLFEQKGPILYLIHMFAALISDTSFIGVFCFQVLAFSIFLYFANKIINLYLPKGYSYYILPILSFLLLTMQSYRYGDSAEEFCLPLLTISLYTLLKRLKKRKESPSNKFFLFNGILAGLVLWIKYTMLGFWFGFMIFFLVDTIRKKNYSKILPYCFYFLSGMFLSSIPIFLYFGIHHSIKDLFHCYFWINMTTYTSKLTLGARIIWLYQTFFHKFIKEILFGLVAFFGIYALLSGKEKRKIKWALFICGFFLVLGVYGGGRAYSYYFFIFAPLALLGLISVFKRWKKKKEILAPHVLLITLSCFALTFALQSNTKDLFQPKENYAQFEFANIIKARKEKPTLLNYGFLDGGFYLTTQTLPNIKYFMKNNIPYEYFKENMDEQNKAIKEQKVDYVILLMKEKWDLSHIRNKDLFQNYKLIQTKKQKVEGKNQIYYLFEKKERN